MKFVEVKELPVRRGKKNLRVFIDEFMVANIKIAKIEIGENEYSSISVARSCIYTAVTRSGAPITVTQRGDEIYFIRRDM